jgi:putative acyl-CoA dehydrogenase
LETARGAYAALDRAIDKAKARLKTVTEPHARVLVEELALALQGALLARHAPKAVADAFVATRLGETPWRTYGAFDAEIDVRAIVARAMPAR